MKVEVVLLVSFIWKEIIFCNKCKCRTIRFMITWITEFLYLIKISANMIHYLIFWSFEIYNAEQTFIFAKQEFIIFSAYWTFKLIEYLTSFQSTY